MASKIQIKRGLKVSLPALSIGELGFCTDTKELYIGGTSGNVLVNPAVVSPVEGLALNAVSVNPYSSRVEIKSSQNWVCPAGVTKVDVFLVGGGGGGSTCGGGGGYVGMIQNVSVTPGVSYPIVVGAGGVGEVSSQTNGGTTSAFGYSKSGGYAGIKAGIGAVAVGGNGGCGGGGCGYGNYVYGGNGGTNGQNGNTAYSPGGQGQCSSTTDPYTGISYGGGGGGAGSSSSNGGSGGGYVGGGGGHSSSVANGGGDSGTGGSSTGGKGGTNTGGGGGGGGTASGSAFRPNDGGSGIVIIYY